MHGSVIITSVIYICSRCLFVHASNGSQPCNHVGFICHNKKTYDCLRSLCHWKSYARKGEYIDRVETRTHFSDEICLERNWDQNGKAENI